MAELDHIEVCEKAKEGYESDVAEDLCMDVDETKIKTDKSERNENNSSDDNYAASE